MPALRKAPADSQGGLGALPETQSGQNLMKKPAVEIPAWLIIVVLAAIMLFTLRWTLIRQSDPANIE